MLWHINDSSGQVNDIVSHSNAIHYNTIDQHVEFSDTHVKYYKW